MSILIKIYDRIICCHLIDHIHLKFMNKNDQKQKKTGHIKLKK